jgi:hypothetical protein
MDRMLKMDDFNSPGKNWDTSDSEAHALEFREFVLRNYHDSTCT